MTPEITLDVAGAKVTLPAATLTALWLERVRWEAMFPTQDAPHPPRIGQEWDGQGGVYAGICRGADGAADHHLVVHTDEAKAIGWKDAIAWASAQGPYNYSLPTRAELAVLFGNVPELFAKEWYWSGEQSAGDDESAWYQDFTNGHQTSFHKSLKLRARAVRRVPIE